VRAYLRAQPTHHPRDVIAGWGGDEPQYETAGEDEWRSGARNDGGRVSSLWRG
jgi:hypothetical protein